MAKDSYKIRIEPRLDEIEQWISDGVSFRQISKNLGISESTFYEQINKHSEISEAITRGKTRDAKNLESILHQRASGFTGPDGRYYPPDTKALLSLLSNRDPAGWSNRAQLDAKVSLSEEDRKLLEQVQKRTKPADSSENNDNQTEKS